MENRRARHFGNLAKLPIEKHSEIDYDGCNPCETGARSHAEDSFSESDDDPQEDQRRIHRASSDSRAYSRFLSDTRRGTQYHTKSCE